jgi:tetratricopeptide (TPR) repeat protein
MNINLLLMCLLKIKFLAALFLLLFQISCQKQPSISAAAMPSARKAVAPMGSATNNADFEKKRLLFETKAPTKPGLARDFFWADFYFYERRFIEAAQILSGILDQNAKYPHARNLLARCFYFLGNPDRSYAELDFVLSHPSENAEELLDALFLMGAIALESPASSAKVLKKGIAAWETYLKIAPKNELFGKIEPGLKELRTKLKNPKKDVLVSKNKADDPQTRFQKLPRDAKIFEKLKAQGLDAFDAEDLLLATKKLKEALAFDSTNAEINITLGRILIKTNRFSEALAKFQQVTKLHPRHVSGWHYQGMAYMMSANPQKAVESWKRVMQLDPKYGAQFNLQDRIAVATGMIQ